MPRPSQRAGRAREDVSTPPPTPTEEQQRLGGDSVGHFPWDPPVRVELIEEKRGRLEAREKEQPATGNRQLATGNQEPAIRNRILTVACCLLPVACCL
jgi:hypothetical protein